MPKCKKCKREYMRKYCDYCRREARWNPKKYFNRFTPRLQEGLQDKHIDIEVDPKVLKYVRSGHGLYIFGEVGSGKTLLAAHMMLASMKSYFVEKQGPQRHIFITVADLLDKIKESYNHETDDDITKLYGHVDFLVLDDLGVEKTSDWTVEKVYQIINTRYEEMKPTIFTSNLNLNELSESIGDRISSRIKGMSRLINTGEEDYRL